MGAPVEVSDDNGVSKVAGSVFVGSGVTSDAVNVVGACKSVGGTLKVVCCEAFGINMTDGVDAEEELAKLEEEEGLLEVANGVDVEDVGGGGGGEEVL